MATTDFSGLSDDELDGLYKITQNSPSLIPDDAERQAVIMEWSKRRAGLKPRAPDNVESNLEASATPITPDPAVKPRAAAKPLTGEQRAADLEAQGDLNNPQRGLRPGQSVGEYGEEYGAAIRQRREEKFADVMARRAAGEQDPDQAAYNAATGMPGESSLPPMDGYNEHTGEYTTPRVLHPMIARDRAIAQQQEAEHAAMIEAKYGPEIAARWRAGDKSAIIPQHRKDDNAHWAKVEHDAYFNNDPAARAALRARDQGFRDFYNDPRQKERRAAMKAEKDARLAHWRAMTMLAGGSQNINGANRGMFSQLAMLPDDAPAGGGMSPRQQQLAYALPGGRERAAVDAAHNRQLTEIGLRVATGRGFQDMTPEQQQAFGLQAQNAAAQQAAGIQQDAEALVNERADSVGWNNLMTRIFGGGVEGFDNTLLTIAEEEEAIRKLMARYPHLTYEQARQHVEAAASGKTRQPRNAPPPSRETDANAGSVPAVSA